MTRRTIIVLVIIYVAIVTSLFWATFATAHAVMVSLEVVQPEPVMIERTQPDVVDRYSEGIPGTWNPQN